MTLSVTELVAIPSPVNDGLVDLLEDLLGAAKAGKLQTLIGLSIERGGESATYQSIPTGTDLIRLIGLVDRLKVRLHRDLDAVVEEANAQ